MPRRPPAGERAGEGKAVVVVRAAGVAVDDLGQFPAPGDVVVAVVDDRQECGTVPVPDLDTGLRFYRDFLGHELRWRNDAIGQAGLGMPSGGTEIVLTTSKSTNRTGSSPPPPTRPPPSRPPAARW